MTSSTITGRRASISTVLSPASRPQHSAAFAALRLPGEVTNSEVLLFLSEMVCRSGSSLQGDSSTSVPMLPATNFTCWFSRILECLGGHVPNALGLHHALGLHRC